MRRAPKNEPEVEAVITRKLVKEFSITHEYKPNTSIYFSILYGKLRMDVFNHTFAMSTDEARKMAECLMLWADHIDARKNGEGGRP